MPKLNDTQLILLSTAAQRDDGSLLPPPETLVDAGDRASKAIAALIRCGLAEERETTTIDQSLRTDGDIHRGVFITEAGTAAIDPGPTDRDADAPPPAPPKSGTKRDAVIALLQRESGATLGELIEATDWLPHTTRAALTGLRKKGHAIERSKRGEATCYRITVAAY